MVLRLPGCHGTVGRPVKHYRSWARVVAIIVRAGSKFHSFRRLLRGAGEHSARAGTFATSSRRRASWRKGGCGFLRSGREFEQRRAGFKCLRAAAKLSETEEFLQLGHVLNREMATGHPSLGAHGDEADDQRGDGDSAVRGLQLVERLAADL